VARTNVGTTTASSRPGRLVPGGRTVRVTQTLLRVVTCQVSQTRTLLRRVMAVNESAVAPVFDLADCCPVSAPAAAVVRVRVEHRVIGGTRVSWELAETFFEAGPYEVRLQASPSGVADSDDWVDVGVPAVDPAYLVDDRQRTWGVEEVLHYRVVLVTAAGGTHVSAAVRPEPLLDARDWLIAREMARKERLRLATGTGAAGFLLKARRYGVRCSCVNPTTRERTDSHCPSCYGVGIVGGYHPPVPCTLAEFEPHNSRQMTSYAEGRGTTHDVVFTARLAPGLPVVQEDVWVGVGDDARYQIHRVWATAKHRGVVVVQSAEFRRLPRTSIAYRVPVNPSTAPGCEWGSSEAGSGRPGDDATPVEICMPLDATC
jgi:hypothetical protein